MGLCLCTGSCSPFGELLFSPVRVPVCAGAFFLSLRVTDCLFRNSNSQMYFFKRKGKKIQYFISYFLMLRLTNTILLLGFALRIPTERIGESESKCNCVRIFGEQRGYLSNPRRAYFVIARLSFTRAACECSLSIRKNINSKYGYLIEVITYLFGKYSTVFGCFSYSMTGSPHVFSFDSELLLF